MAANIIRLLPDQWRLLLYSQFDFGDQEFLFFEEKVIYVALQRRESYKYYRKSQLQAIAANLKLLNPDLSKERLTQALLCIMQEHFHFGFGEAVINTIVDWVFKLFTIGKLRLSGIKRRLIFKPGTSLSKAEKQEIIGRFSNRKITSEEQVYDLVEFMRIGYEKITYSKLATELNCSVKTIQRYSSNEVKNLIKDLNEDLRIYLLQRRVNEAMWQLTLRNEKKTRSKLKKESGLSGADIILYYKILKHEQERNRT